MAVEPTTLTRTGELGAIIKQWAGLDNAANNTGSPVELATFADRSVQVEGTLGAGFGLVIEGSNDGVNYRTLRDYVGSNLSFTVQDIKSIDSIVRYVRPRVTGGDGTTNVNVTLLLRS